VVLQDYFFIYLCVFPGKVEKNVDVGWATLGWNPDSKRSSWRTAGKFLNSAVSASPST
jgi:hypothetical protein